MSFLYKFNTKKIFFTIIILEAIAIFLILNYVFSSLSNQTNKHALENMQAMTLKVSEQVDTELQRVQSTTKIIADAYMRNYNQIKQNNTNTIESWKNQMNDNKHTWSIIHDGINDPNSPHLYKEFQSFVSKKTEFNQEVVNRLDTAARLKELFHGIYNTFNYSFIYISTYNNLYHIYPSASLEYEKYAASPTTKHYYEAADFKNKTFGWEEPYEDIGGTGQMVTVSYPFYDKKEKLQGVVSHDITIEQLLNRFLKNIELYNNSTIILVSQMGKAISTNNQLFNDEIAQENKDTYRGLLYYLTDDKLNIIKQENSKFKNSKNILLNQLSTKSMNKLKNKKYYTFEHILDNKIYQVSAVKIPTTNWFIINAVPNEEILGHLNETNKTMQVAIAILLSLLYLTIAMVYYFRFFTPIETITKVTDEIAKGNLNQKLQTNFDGEIGELFKNYSKMIQNLISAKELSNNYSSQLESEVKNRTKEIEIKNKLLEELSITDALTNIYNRRHFNEVFPKVINSAKRNNDLVSFLIMDIDHFKQYNDTYGHQMGDDVLIKVAKAIKDSLNRTDDYCFRLGGEEFGVIFKANSKEKALEFANKIKENIENLHIAHNGNSASSYVTASMGLICKNAKDISTDDEVYKEADDLLYKAKERGRNKVEYL